MRTAAKILVGIVAVFSALALAGFGFFVFTFGWPPPDCGAQSAAVAKARQLSQPQLAQLHAEMHELANAEPAAHSVPDDLWPGAIAELEPRKVATEIRPRIMLEGCFDHFVFLQFEGIPGELRTQQPRILLSWGDGPDAGEELLWQP